VYWICATSPAGTGESRALGVQLLDGVGAGIFGAITPLVLADLMRGTGRYNIAQGAVATVQGIGASSSGLVAGLIVDKFGYTAAFGEAAVVAAIALAALGILMPETVTPEHETSSTKVTLAESFYTSGPAEAGADDRPSSYAFTMNQATNPNRT
jgi:MFS family permease